jgi:hypothetical protein
MAEKMTGKQVRDDYLLVLGPTLGPPYYSLYNEIAWLHAKWNQYRILFAESERVKLLNGIAGFFFRVIQNVLWEDVVLHIARLTDPLKSAGKDNLTLLRLPAALQAPVLASEVKILVERAQTAAKFARDWRNRYLAHRDLNLATDSRAMPLPGISRENIEQALSTARAVMSIIERHYWQREVAFTHFIAHGDAESLASYLEFAIDADNRQREQALQGCALPKDFKR